MVIFTGLFTLRVGTVAEQVDRSCPRGRGSWATCASRRTACGSRRPSWPSRWRSPRVYRFTRFGLVTRAAAETEKGAYVSGISPDRVAALNWMISAAVAAISGILIAPIVPLTPFGYTFFIVPALAAAVLGHFQHMLLAVAGGLAIGMVQSELDLPARPGLVAAQLRPGRAGAAAPDPVGARGAGQAAAEPRRDHPAAPSDGRPGRERSAVRPSRPPRSAVVALAVLQGPWRAALITSLIFGDPLPVARRRDRLLRSGVPGTADHRRGRRIPAGAPHHRLAGPAPPRDDPVPARTDRRGPRGHRRRRARRPARAAHPGSPRRGRHARARRRHRGVVVPQLRHRRHGRRGVAGPKLFGLDLRARVGADFPRLPFGLLALAVLVAVAVGVAKLRQSDARVGDARGPGQRAVRGRRRRRRRPREDPGVRPRLRSSPAWAARCSPTSRAT